MNANLKWIASALAATVALSACSSTGTKPTPAKQPAQTQAQPAQQQAQAASGPQTVKVDSIDSTKEVAYKCGAKGEEKLTVMYGVKNNQLVAAQVRFKNELTPNLFRVIGANDQNIFWGENVAWFAEKATPANVDKVDGGMLTIRGTTQVNGKAEVVDQIVTRGCLLDKTATARLKK
ncbi:hypothetical protein ACFPVS_01545 [Neisseria weixii]|uniref:Excinuclease ABC subunit A n=1 Tax=Neisseria weixii TaxID=1853276 RepID=A0A3N4N1J6_9NEIS|nr:hypothetical protein [Neisseria weixii]ATD64535.1 hypothetical protein CGZ65_03000 [Neisseria weixii]RPD90114.1 hypothetical protein EGK74_02110 [Neisseria weixii]RPD90312.1 hypothetical protein EGK75_02410 [Neisseria weixii]